MALSMLGALTVADVTPIEDDGEALLGAGRRLATALTWVAEDTTAANKTWAGLPDVLAGPRLTPTLEPLMNPVAARATQLRDAGDEFYRVTKQLADEIANLQTTHDQLVADIEAFHASAPGKAAEHASEQAESGNVAGAVATVLTSWGQVPALVGDEIALRARLEAYETKRSDTIDTATRQINAIDVPTTKLSKVDSASDAAALLEKGMAPATVAALAGVSIGALLRELSTTQLKNVFADNAKLRTWLRTRTVSEANSWWKKLTDAQKDGVITGAPGIVGALNGIPYTDRSTANQKLLHRTMASLKKAGRTDTDEYKALAAVRKTMRQGDGKKLVYQLVSLTLGSEPLAAISVGDLDTAKNVTYMVPGMRTTVESSIKSDVGAAKSLRDQQSMLVPGALSSANVAWIGYHTPQGAGETVSTDAIAGGKLLASDLNGLDATRAAQGTPTENTSVIAHSYGTITSAYALQTAHVDHAVFEGSPGIPTAAAAKASDLNVPKGEVFATQSSQDQWAQTGQTFSIGRVNPAESQFGAHVFSSDGTNGMRAVTNHGPIDGKSSTRASYWDAGTQAMYDAAKATLGKGASIPVGGLQPSMW